MGHEHHNPYHYAYVCASWTHNQSSKVKPHRDWDRLALSVADCIQLKQIHLTSDGENEFYQVGRSCGYDSSPPGIVRRSANLHLEYRPKSLQCAVHRSTSWYLERERGLHQGKR